MLHISLTKAVERRNVAYTDGVIQEGYPPPQESGLLCDKFFVGYNLKQCISPKT